MNEIIQGDSLEVLKTLPSESVDCVITSPPYWALRDYGVIGQLGLEPTFQEYITKLCDIFDEAKRVLKKRGTCWVNLGDTYNGNKSGNTDTNKNGKVSKENLIKKKSSIELREKSLCQIPSRFSIEMSNRGWILRNRIIWHKPNVMPQSCKDRFTVDFEDIFFFTKSLMYDFEQQKEPVSEVSLRRAEYAYKTEKANIGTGISVENMGSRFVDAEGRNMRTVWKIPTSASNEEHVAMFPQSLIEPMVLAGCPKGGIVLDIFMGSGTTGLVAKKLGRNYLGIELNPKYIKIANDRINGQTPPML